MVTGGSSFMILFYFAFIINIYRYDFNKTGKGRLVLDLYYNQSKNTREISQVGMSFRDIGTILKKA